MKCYKIIPLNKVELNQVTGNKGTCECWGSTSILERLFGHYQKIMNSHQECKQWCEESIGGRFWVFQDNHGQTWVSRSVAPLLPKRPLLYTNKYD